MIAVTRGGKLTYVCSTWPQDHMYMHSVVIHTWHVLHALWSVGSMYIQSRAIRTCTPESYIHTLWTLGSCVPAIQGHTWSFIHALWSLGSYKHAIQGHTYMQSKVIHTCYPGPYLHALRGHTYIPFRVWCIHDLGILEKREHPVQLRSIALCVKPLRNLEIKN